MSKEIMRDVLKLDEANAWALGCDHCTFGVIDPPPPKLCVPLYILRAFHLQFGLLAVCDCRAGQAYERYLRRVWQDVLAKEEHIPDTWSTAIHHEINEMAKPPAMPLHEGVMA